MLILSFAVGLVPLDPERVIALRRVSDAVFKRPVRLDEQIAVEGEVARVTAIDEAAGLVDLGLSIVNQDDALVCRVRVQSCGAASEPGALGRALLARLGHPRRARRCVRAGAAVMLAGRRLLVTGVLDPHSIAFETAERAQELGAEVILTGFGRTRRMTERAAARLPRAARCSSWTSTREADLRALREQLQERWAALDGLLHAVAYAPPDALGGALPRHPLRERGDGLSRRAPSR